jgi:hypothetical protein
MSGVEELIGRALPGGHFTLEGYEDWLMRDVMLNPPVSGPILHPLSIFSALQRSIGMTLAQFFALCGAHADEGPMLGDTRIDIVTPLRIDHEYAVRAAITGAQRKVGKKAGVIDIVQLTIECLDLEGSPGHVAARVVNSYIFRRSEAS